MEKLEVTELTSVPNSRRIPTRPGKVDGVIFWGIIIIIIIRLYHLFLLFLILPEMLLLLLCHV